jgi:hypothetical protein
MRAYYRAKASQRAFQDLIWASRRRHGALQGLYYAARCRRGLPKGLF